MPKIIFVLGGPGAGKGNFFNLQFSIPENNNLLIMQKIFFSIVKDFEKA